MFQLFLFLSTHQQTCLKKSVRRLEHQMSANARFTHHSESEFVQFIVSKLVKWAFFIACPRLFRSLTTETPTTRSESCCVSSHFFPLSCSCFELLQYLHRRVSHQDTRASHSHRLTCHVVAVLATVTLHNMFCFLQKTSEATGPVQKN